MTGDLRLLSMMEILNNYNARAKTYEVLWAKYGQSPVLPTPTKSASISTQEEAIQASLKLKSAFEVLGRELGKSPDEVCRLFIEGATKASAFSNKLHSGLSNIHHWITTTPEQIAQRFSLLFEFDCIDDLFLSDESEISSVMNIE